MNHTSPAPMCPDHGIPIPDNSGCPLCVKEWEERQPKAKVADKWVDPNIRLPKNEYRLFAVMPDAVGTITCELNRSGIIESLAAHPEQTFKWLDNEGDPQADKEGYERAIYALRAWVKDLQKKIDQAEPLQQIGLRWVTDRNPPEAKKYFVKCKVDGDEERHMIEWDGKHWAEVEEYDFYEDLEIIAWLEESPEQPLSVQQETKQAGHSFCDKEGHFCDSNWCNHHGCIELRRRHAFQPSPSIEIEQKAPTISPIDGAASFHPDSPLMRGTNDKRHLPDTNVGDIPQQAGDKGEDKNEFIALMSGIPIWKAGEIAKYIDALVFKHREERKADAERIAALEKERDDYRRQLEFISDKWELLSKPGIVTRIRNILSQHPHQSKTQQ